MAQTRDVVTRFVLSVRHRVVYELLNQLFIVWFEVEAVLSA
jgi:hypothetical protein